jgi:hypothetical protein
MMLSCSGYLLRRIGRTPQNRREPDWPRMFDRTNQAPNAQVFSGHSLGKPPAAKPGKSIIPLAAIAYPSGQDRG